MLRQVIPAGSRVGHPTMTPVALTKKAREFDPYTFLATIGDGRKFLAVPKKKTWCSLKETGRTLSSTSKPAK